jgi:hypothetical protein
MMAMMTETNFRQKLPVTRIGDVFGFAPTPTRLGTIWTKTIL